MELFRRLQPFYVTRSALDQAKIKKFMAYYRNNFGGGQVIRDGEVHPVPPRFDPNKWNCWIATLRGWPRTNNFNEGLNRAAKRRHFRGASPRLSHCIRLDKKEEWKLSTRYRIAQDNPRNGNPRPIVHRSARQRAKEIGKSLRAQCEEYQREKNRLTEEGHPEGTAAGRQEHVQAISRILSRYRHRSDYTPKEKDAQALGIEEVEAMELQAPGATEEEE